MHWLPLALLCALSLALADAGTKKWLAARPPAELVLIRFGLPGLLLVPVLWLADADLASLPVAFWGWVAAALPLELLAMSLYVRAISASPLSHTLPYMAFTPVFTLLTGWVMLGETVSGQGLAGIFLVVAGAWGLNLGRTGWRPRSWLLPFRAILENRGSRTMLAVAMIYSVTAVLGKGAMQYLPGQAFGALYFVLVGAFAFVVFGLRHPGSIRRAVLAGGHAWIVAALMAFMVLTHFLALAQVETAYMIAVKRTSVLFGILLGAWLFREAGLARHLAAAALMVAGVALIAL